MYFARIVFLLDDNYCFMNLSEKPVQLFTDGDAECTAHIDTRTNHCKVILEYGGFSSQQEAEEKGINLVRQIKIEMVKREFTINIAGCSGQLDSSTIHVYHGGISAWKQLCDECEEKHGTPMRRDHIIENEYIGLSVYEVAQDIHEIMFVSASMEMQSKQKLSLSHDVLPYWNESMDTSLSLLSSSVGINDQRAQFLLRLMAIEVLVPPSLLREDDYLAVIDQLKKYAKQMDIKPEYKDRITNQLGQFREQSITQKVSSLLDRYLPDRLYMEQSPKQFFKQCYRLRSGLVHNGASSSINSEITYALKRLLLDLLQAMSSTPD